MNLYLAGQRLNEVLGELSLSKSRGEAAATLSAVLITAAADTFYDVKICSVFNIWDRPLCKRHIGIAGICSRSIIRYTESCDDQFCHFCSRNCLIRSVSAVFIAVYDA